VPDHTRVLPKSPLEDPLLLFSNDTVTIIFAHDKMLIAGILNREPDGRDLPALPDGVIH